MTSEKVKKIIKSLYQEGEIDNIIKIDNDSAFEYFRDLDFIKTEREAAQEYKDTLDMIEEKKNIEEMDLIPLIVSCKSILILQTIIFKMLDNKREASEKEITKWLIDNVFRNEEYYMLHDEETLNDMIWNLMEIIASLHNEYYKEVNGKYYDYMFHWVNKMNCGSIIDNIFKKNNIKGE